MCLLTPHLKKRKIKLKLKVKCFRKRYEKFRTKNKRLKLMNGIIPFQHRRLPWALLNIYGFSSI